MEMVDIACDQCLVVFSIPKNVDERLRKSGADFFCPVGHDMSYGKKKSVDDTMLETIKYSRDCYKRSLSATQGVVTKLRKEIVRLKKDKK